MSLLFKVPIFIAFLIALIAWIVVGFYLFKKLLRGLLRGKSFLVSELTILVTCFVLFGLVWLLSGFFSIRFIILFILCCHIGVIITGISWRLIGATDLPWAASLTWTGVEFGLKHPWVVLCVQQILPLLILIAYPIASGIGYFSNPIPSPRATILIFRYTLIAMYGPALATTLLSTVTTLSSRNLDEGSRLRVLISQAGALIVDGLIIALVFWAFGITRKGYNFEVSGITLTMSPFLVFVILGYFGCTILLPYFVGTQQAKKWCVNLLEKEKGWLSNLLEVIEFPTPSQYRPKLEQLQSALVSEEQQMVENDAMVKLGIEIDGIKSTTSLPWGERNLIEAYKDSRGLEPRFTYIDFIRHLKSEIGEILDELAKVKNDTDKVDRARAFTQPYHSHKDELAKSIEVKRKAKPIIGTALVGIVLAIIVPFLNELGKWIWVTFMQTLD